MPLRDRLVGQFRHSRASRRTVRMRLTLLYGALFILCGAGLLTMTYLLVQHATAGIIVKDEGNTLVVGNDGTIRILAAGTPSPGPTLPQEQARAVHDGLTAEAARQRAALSHEFVTQSTTALGVTAVVAIGFGYVMAGRVLRPLRTITTATRRISATNLHQRLGMRGPQDELKELGETIDDLLARLEASFQSQHRFVANASHELRTPVALQRTSVQLALSDPDATVDSLRNSCRLVLDATYQQERLIDALLTLARGERGLDRRERLDLAAAANDVLLAREAEAARRGIHLAPTLQPAMTFGDPQLVERLVANLVDNALRYNVATGWLEISTGTGAGGATLTVANTGPVVPADDVNRLFQPFERLGVERTHRDGGLGLGLSIVHAIANAHGATIAANPRPSGGMDITVTFPDSGSDPAGRR